MSAQTQATPDVNKRRNGALVGGAILISIGMFSLLENVFHMSWGLYFLPMLAVIFLVAGVLTRRPGLLVPGGILAGIGAGSILAEQVFRSTTDPVTGGIFLLAFAGGWLLITLAGLLINSVMLWPLFPAAFLGLTGLALVAGQTGWQLLQIYGYFWPIVMIVIGAYLILRRKNS